MNLYFFVSNKKYYKQVDGVAMGSPLGLTLAQIFIIVLKVNGFKILCSIDVVLIPFLQFSSPYHADEFKEYLSSKHLTVTFSIDKENDG